MARASDAMTEASCVPHALVAVIIALCLSYASPDTLCNSNDPYLLSDTLAVLEGTLRALVERIQYLNADVMVGLRIVADQLLVEINRLNSTGETRNCGFVFPETSTNLDTKQLRSRLEYLHDAVEYYIPPGMEMVARKISSDFYNNVLVPLSEVGRWNFSLPLISTNPALLVEPDYNFDFQEEHSDACIAELTMAKKKAECNTSGDCIWRMTLKNATSYWLTHEVFFMFIAYNSPCFDDILQILGGLRRGDLQDFLRHACTNTLRDAELIARLGFPSEHQDLFIEQSTFCGLAGVEEFFRPEWVRLVYSWRRPDNCYEEEPAHPANEKTRHTRRKRYDVTTPDRCRVHKTILAAMYTTTVLRFLLH